MIAFLARRNLVRQRARTLLCVLGLGATTALLYDMALLSTGLRASLAHVLEEIGYDLRVLPKGGLPFSSEAVLPNGQALATELERLPGVADALPLWATTLYVGRAGHARRLVSAFALGLDPARQTLYRIEQGQAIPDSGFADAIPIVLNSRLADSLGVAPGDTLEVMATLDASAGSGAGSARARVAGVGTFRFDLRQQRTAALRPNDLARLAGRTDDPASFVLGRLAPGANAADVVARWKALHPETDVYEVSQLLGEIRGQLSYFQQFSLILGTVSLLVTFLLILTLLTLSVNERQGEIAILRALGLKASRVVLLVLLEGCALALLALPLGLLAGTFAARGLDHILTSSPGLPAGLSFFVATPGALARTAGLVFVTAALAGLYPAWLASRTNVALTLHREVT